MKQLTALLSLLCLFTLTGCKTISEQVGSADSPQRVASLVQEHGYFDLTCRDAAGQIKWQENDVPNALANMLWRMRGQYPVILLLITC